MRGYIKRKHIRHACNIGSNCLFIGAWTGVAAIVYIHAIRYTMYHHKAGTK